MTRIEGADSHERGRRRAVRARAAKLVLAIAVDPRSLVSAQAFRIMMPLRVAVEQRP